MLEPCWFRAPSVRRKLPRTTKHTIGRGDDYRIRQSRTGYRIGIRIANAERGGVVISTSRIAAVMPTTILLICRASILTCVSLFLYDLVTRPITIRYAPLHRGPFQARHPVAARAIRGFWRLERRVSSILLPM